MSHVRNVSLAIAATAIAGCATPCPPPAIPAPASPPPALAPAPAPAPTAAAPVPAEREKVAVLPLDDDELFRDERVVLRQLLAVEIARRAPDFEVLPLADVDAKLDASRCAYPGSPRARRARDQGWAPTSLTHVLGTPGKPEELWVDIDGWQSKTTFTALWDPRLTRVNRYRTAFSTLVRQPAAQGLLGGLGLSGNRKDSLVVGGLDICETQLFGTCVKRSQAFADVAPALSKCFAPADEASAEVLFEGARCELAGGSASPLEQCLCSAVEKSAGARAGSGRRTLSLDYQAADLVGKARPVLSVIEASNNLFVDKDWRSVQSAGGGTSSWQRLVVDNLDAAAAPLARCKVPAGAVVTAELSVSGTGSVSSARILSGAPSHCVEAALSHAAFACTDDGKSATLRLAARWP